MAADSAHETDAVETVRQWVNSARFDEELIELETQTLRAMLAAHDATVAELERLRAERADQVRLARSAYSAGWTVHAALAANAVQHMGVDLREQSARDYADEIFPAQAAARPDTAPQQPAQPCPSTAVSDETKGDQ